MKAFVKKKKGSTLIEVIVSFTLIAVVSVPIMMMFNNSVQTNKQSKEQIELNAITRIVKQHVVEGIKGAEIFGNTGVWLTDGTGTYFTRSNLVVRDFENNEYEQYKFNAEALGSINGNIRLQRYLLKIFKKQNDGTYKIISSFRVEANTLPN